MKSIAALAALGLVSAKGETVDMTKLPVFNQASFAKNSILKSMLSNSLYSVSDANDAGMVTYSQCDDDAGIFTLDDQATSNTPQPLTKGVSLQFSLAGILGDHMEVKNVHVHVDWNGTPLYDEDHNQDNQYDDTYAYQLGWDVPAFAPDGDYKVIIKGVGSTSSMPDGTNVYCMEADFTF